MSGEKIADKTILRFLLEKKVSSRAVAKEINEGEGAGTVNELVGQNCFRHFKEGDTSLVDKLRLG